MGLKNCGIFKVAGQVPLNPVSVSLWLYMYSLLKVILKSTLKAFLSERPLVHSMAGSEYWAANPTRSLQSPWIQLIQQ